MVPRYLASAIARPVDDLVYAFRRRPLETLLRGCLVFSVFAAFATCGGLYFLSFGIFDDRGPQPVRIGEIDFGLDYGHWHHARQFPWVEDTDGRSMGMLPPALMPGTLDDRERDPVYRTSHPGPLPPHFWDLVVVLEDRHHDRWFSVFGIDFKSLLRAVLTGGSSGGSTTLMMLAKTIHADTDVRGPQRVIRKLRDLIHAPLLHVAFQRQAPNTQARWFATHIPFLRSHHHGLMSASWILFRKKPSVLNLGETAFLAAAVKWRVPLLGHDPNGGRRMARAQKALLLLKAEEQISVQTWERALAELKDAAALHNQHHATPCLQDFNLAAQRARLRPDVYAATAFHDLLDQAAQEVRKLPGWRRLERIRLTVNVDKICRSRIQVQDRWQTLIARHPRLRQAWYTIAIAAEDGRLIDFGANAKQARYHGPEIPGQTTLALGPREVGSIAKVLAALVLARSGDSPNTMYRQLPRRKANGEAYVNMGGFRGSLHRKISARRAFAQSDNLALMARLEDEAPEELRSLLRVFGFRPRNPNTKLPMESIEALVLGTAKATPRDIHRLFQVVGLNLHKSSNSKTSCTTHLVQAVKSAAQGWKAIDPQWMGCQSARRLLRTDSEQKYLREVLEGVVSPGGTAHSALGQFRPSKNDRIQFHIAKTGTVGKANGVNRYGAVAGALVLDGRLYTYVAQIGANAGFHLGRHVGGRHAADLVQPALERLISRSSR